MPEQERYEIELLFEDLLRDNVPHEERRASFIRTAISMLIRTGVWREKDENWRSMELYVDYSALWAAYLLKLEGCDTCVSSDEESAGRSGPEQRKYKGNSRFEKLLVEKGLDTKVTPSAYRRLVMEEIEAAESFEELLERYMKEARKASSDSGRRREEEKKEIRHTRETDEAEQKVIPQQKFERKTEAASPVPDIRQKEVQMEQEIAYSQKQKESLNQRFIKMLEKKLKIKSLAAIPRTLTEEQERLPDVERWRRNG